MTKRIATTILATPPVLSLLRHRALRTRPLTVLCYHTLGPDRGGIDGWTVLRQGDFRAQLSDLRRHYRIVSLDDGLSGDPGAGKPRAVITFDDGDRGLAAHLLPILRERALPVTIYVATGQFETRRPFWFDRVVNAWQGAGEIDVERLGRWRIPKARGKARWTVLGQVLEALKTADPAHHDALADQVAAQGAAPQGDGLGPMSLDDLKTLATMPGVTIGAHSHGHELLDRIPPEAARKSVARSRDLLREWTGQEIRHFAYPNGNHTPELRTMIRDLGFASAAALEERTAPPDFDPFALPRISIGRYDSAARVRLRLVGL